MIDIQILLYKITAHPLFSALLMGIMNVGGRFILADIPKKFEHYLANHQWVRKIVWFAIFFVATRDWKTALFATLAVTVVFQYLMKESSAIADAITEKIVPGVAQPTPQAAVRSQ